MAFSQSIRKKKGIKKLVVNAKVFFRQRRRPPPVGTPTLTSMSDSSSSISLSGSVISAENPSPFLCPLSFQLDEDFHLLAEMTWYDGVHLSTSPQGFTAKNSLESNVDLLRPPASPVSQMEPLPDDSNLSRSSSQTTASLSSTLTSESRSSSPRTWVASTEIASTNDISTKNCTLPLEHPCVDSARQIGIKVRDFAYEDHGVKPAPVVDELDGLKGEYLRYLSHGQIPPRATIDLIKLVDLEWFQEQEKKFTSTC